MRPAICPPYRRAQRRPGPGSRVWKMSPSGGGRRKTVRTHASARSSSAASVQGRITTEPPREPVRFAGRRNVVVGADATGEPPQLARRSSGPHGAGAVPRTCPGQRDCIVTATGRATGDRADNAASPAEPSGTTGDVRSSERLTPAGRPSVDGSPFELPRLAQRFAAALPGRFAFSPGPTDRPPVDGGPPAPSGAAGTRRVRGFGAGPPRTKPSDATTRSDAQTASSHHSLYCGSSPRTALA